MMKPVQNLTHAPSCHPPHPNSSCSNSAQASSAPLPSCSSYSAAQYTEGPAALTSVGCCCCMARASTRRTCAARRRCTTYAVCHSQLSNQIQSMRCFRQPFINSGVIIHGFYMTCLCRPPHDRQHSNCNVQHCQHDHSGISAAKLAAAARRCAGSFRLGSAHDSNYHQCDGCCPIAVRIWG